MLRAHPFSRSSLWFKAGAGLLLAGLADLLLFLNPVGATLGLFTLAWTVILGLVRPGLIRDRRALFALAAAAILAAVMIDRPGVLAGLMFGLMLSLAALSIRVRGGEPAWRWSQRLAVNAAVSAAGPIIDLVRLSKVRRRRRTRGPSPGALLKALVLPVAGGLVFLSLFASANPLIAAFLDQARLPAPSGEGVLRVVFWIVLLLMAGATLRPRWRRRLLELPTLGDARMPGVSGRSITLSLIVFNAVFALQNGLDIVFLWSGAPLPGDVGLADYAHKGAYTLIATALLAGLFVLIALRPGSETAARPLVRRLVVAWVAQNMLLVASSIYRTADYVQAYALTPLRITALVWMAMVAAGLALICWRLLARKDGHWLIDANARLVLVVLAAASIVDFSAVAAWWNVRHAREVGGPGVELDLGYLRRMGAPALVSLVDLERRADDPIFRDRVAAVRAAVLAEVRGRQAGWRGWTWRDARRLDKVAALAADHPLLRPRPGRRDWDGALLPPPPPSNPLPLQPSAPLTYGSGV